MFKILTIDDNIFILAFKQPFLNNLTDLGRKRIILRVSLHFHISDEYYPIKKIPVWGTFALGYDIIRSLN